MSKETHDSWSLEFLEKLLANNFALSDAEDNISRPLNRGVIADLPLLRTLLAIHQTSQEPSFWEKMNSFVLLAYASLAASRTFLQWLLACLNFSLDSEDLFSWYKQKKWFIWTMVAAKTVEIGKLTSELGHLRYNSSLNYNSVQQVYQFYQNRLVSPYDGCLSLQRQTH